MFKYILRKHAMSWIYSTSSSVADTKYFIWKQFTLFTVKLKIRYKSIIVYRKSRSNAFHRATGQLSCFQLHRLAGDKWWLQLRLHGYTLRHAVRPLALLPMRAR